MNTQQSDKGFYYDVTEEQLAEHAQRTAGERLRWSWSMMELIASMQTPEERRRTLIAKWDKNIRYYQRFGFPAFVVEDQPAQLGADYEGAV